MFNEIKIRLKVPWNNVCVKIFFMQGVSSALHDAGFLVNYPLTRLLNAMNSKPILNISVYDYLWGYEDTVVKLASGILPNFIDFQKFGLLDRVSINRFLLLFISMKM